MDTTKPPGTENDSIPWYRTRWFWGVVIGVLLAWGMGYYFLAIHQPGFSPARIFNDLSISLGAFLIGSVLLKVFGATVSILIYYFIILLLLFMTFRKEKVAIAYPIIFLVIFLSGHIVGVMFLASFS